MKHSLLIVEDDEATAAFLADNLAADGFGVAVASGAGEGLRAIEVRHPSLVLLDLALDDGNGLLLLDRVRGADGMASRFDPDVPIIVITGGAVRSIASAALRAAPTTTWSSRSTTVSCWAGCAPSSDARRAGRSAA